MSETTGGSGEFYRGVARTGGVVAAFLAFGLLCQAGAASLRPEPAPTYSPAVSEPAPRIWLVDGYNAICTGLLGGRDREGWWRHERRAELLERLGRFEDREAELWVVFDGPRPAGEPEATEGRVRTVYAPSADAWLVEQVRAREEPVAVVTGDRQVADRARHRGAHVVAPSALLGRCLG